MRKTKLLLLTSLSPIISLPFVAAKCNTDAKPEDMNKDKSEKDKMTSELKNSNESTNNDKNNNTKSNKEKSNTESVTKTSEKDIKSEKIIESEMSDMPMKKAIKSEADKRPVNNVDASGHDIGRWYDKVHEEDLTNFKNEFQKILKDIETQITKNAKNESTQKQLKSQFNSLKSKLEKKLDTASTWDHIDEIVDEIDAVIRKV
ncbi:variable surface lipoprotein [Mycoplasmopsis agalactiae]|nr:variable surface lipoprotein [Mycoplasmopsis agalactiae]MCE6056261.1 variable surface lipoprotein [Mycoplasmopsis agalactiae]